MAKMPIGTHAAVLGASIAGLLTARVLADSYTRVTVIERDELPLDMGHRRGCRRAFTSMACTPGAGRCSTSSSPDSPNRSGRPVPRSGHAERHPVAAVGSAAAPGRHRPARAGRQPAVSGGPSPATGAGAAVRAFPRELRRGWPGNRHRSTSHHRGSDRATPRWSHRGDDG